MSIYGAMRTGASGMHAQSYRLGVVADNIANVSTVGYRGGRADFSSLIVNDSSTAYTSGGVETRVRYNISSQGTLAFSNSPFDLAIGGSGFFLVEDASGNTFLTRAGAFVPNGDGELVNAAGYRLLGLPSSGSSSGPVVLNGTAGLEPVRLNNDRLEAVATLQGLLTANLPAGSAVVAAADLPSANGATATSTARSSIVVYDNLGGEQVLDVHFARSSATGDWEVTVFNAADRSASGGFPYASGPLAQTTLTFGADGQLASSSATSLTIPVPNGASMTLDLGDMSQLAADYSVLAVNADGNPPGDVVSVEIASDGTVYSLYSNGSRRAVYTIPLGDVVSPDRLTPVSGNVFQLSGEAGDLLVASAESAGFGQIISGALENSTVDLANELTDMIEAQRNYTANSKVFQTGAELLDVLVNLKR